MSRRFMAAASQYKQRQHQSSSLHNRNQQQQPVEDWNSGSSSSNGSGDHQEPTAKLLSSQRQLLRQRIQQKHSYSSRKNNNNYNNSNGNSLQHHPQTDDPNVSSISIPHSENDQESEIAPEDGALQFLPAYNNNNKNAAAATTTTAPGSSWDEEDTPDDELIAMATAFQPQNQPPQPFLRSAWPDEKKEPEKSSLSSAMPPARSVISANSTTQSSMALRARQYKQQRKAATAVGARNANNNPATTKALLNSAAQALRAKSPSQSRAKSPMSQVARSRERQQQQQPQQHPKSPSTMTMRPKSPSLSSRPKSPAAASRPKSPSLLRPKSPSFFSMRSNPTTSNRPKSPLAAQSPARIGQHPAANTRSRPSDYPDEGMEEESSSAAAPRPAGRVSRLASMFGGEQQQQQQQPQQRQKSPARGRYNNIDSASAPPTSPYRKLSSDEGPSSPVRPVSQGVTTRSATANPATTATTTTTATPISPGGWSARSAPKSPGQQQQQQPLHQRTAIASPSTSTSGSSYVGWPGTQDKRGKIVSLQSSNEETSSAGAGGSTFSWRARPQFPQDGPPTSPYGSSRSATLGAGRNGGASSSVAASLLRRHHLKQPTPTSLDRLAMTSNGNANFVTPSPQQQESRHGQDESQGTDYLSEALGASKALSPPRFSAMASRNSTNLRAAPQPSRSMVLDHEQSGDGMMSDPPSSPSTAFSKTSSAYFNERDMNPLAYPDLAHPQEQQQPPPQSFNPYGNRRAMTAAAAASVLRSQGITEEALAVKDHLTPPHRTFSGGATGYRGLLDKTKDVPCLMDDALNDSDNSYSTSSVASRSSRVDSDVFDGVASDGEQGQQQLQQQQQQVPPLAVPHKFVRSNSRVKKATYPESIAEEEDYHLSPQRKEVRKDRQQQLPSSESKRNNQDPNKKEEPYKVVLLGGGLTAIQSSMDNYTSRQTLDDFDETLSNSEVESNGFTRTPSLAEMMNAGKNANDSSVLLSNLRSDFEHSAARPPAGTSHQSFSPKRVDNGEPTSLFPDDPFANDPFGMENEMKEDVDYSQYYIEPTVMKKLLRVYRQISDYISQRNLSLTELDKLEDENKAFALFEMRSRIMEKDIERGLERRGGTFAVDDIVLTPYYRAAHRVRDAVIVAKAWRDGASPQDVTNTAVLTQRDQTFFIRRPLTQSSTGSVFSGSYGSNMSQRYYWEAVKWIDDTDFALFHCPSLGPRSLRGFEMFTIGDCQSILLKLTNERCVELRKELNAATKEQLVAEELMKEEGEDDGLGMMTESEMTYLGTMERVKTISKQLVVAEQSFTLVRDRIERLVAKYEALLVRIDNEGSVAGASSVVTNDESVYSEDDLDSEAWQEREAQMWARRAKRAELKAEVAAREALMARQEADNIRRESEYELERVQLKLAELQSEASTAISEREHNAVMHKYRPAATNQEIEETNPPATASAVEAIDKNKINSVKQRFRDRMAAKKRMDDGGSSVVSQQMPPRHPQPSRPMGNARLQSRPLAHSSSRQRQPRRVNNSSTKAEAAALNQMFRAAGEEMFSHLDFYERSLKAVQIHD